MPRSSSVGYKFFGAYLRQKGLVTQEQLDDALRFQEESNRRIGELAVDKGLLTPEQVDEIFVEQKIIDAPFGAIALRKKFLRRGDLDDLLFSQAVQSTHLGEALLLRGYLSPEQFGRELRIFKEQEQKQQESLHSLDLDPDIRDFTEMVISSFQRAYLRFAKQAVKLDLSCHTIEREDFKYCFALSASTSGQSRMTATFWICESIAQNIVSPSARTSEESGFDWVGKWLEFFRIVGHYVRQEMDIADDSGVEIVTEGGLQENMELSEQGFFLGLSASKECIPLQVRSETV